MNLSEFVVREAIIPELTADTKEQVIREMVGSLRATGHIPETDEESVVQAILKREEQGTTGIGRGVAVPHSKHNGTKKLVGTVALSSRGVDFSSLDGEPVQIIFLLVSPIDRPGDHLRALEAITRHLRNESFCKFLKQSKTQELISELLDEADQNQFGT